MGAWGLGPFDSDSALDYLGDLFDKIGARQNEDGDVILATVDKTKLVAALHATLTSGPVRIASYVYTDPQTGEKTDKSYEVETSAEVYAAAGLVAAALQTSLVPSVGTSLFARLLGEHEVAESDPIDLSAGMSYVSVLNRDDVVDLVPLAITGVQSLLTDEEWISSWFEREEILRHLTELQHLLSV